MGSTITDQHAHVPVRILSPDIPADLMQQPKVCCGKQVLRRVIPARCPQQRRSAPKRLRLLEAGQEDRPSKPTPPIRQPCTNKIDPAIRMGWMARVERAGCAEAEGRQAAIGRHSNNVARLDMVACVPSARRSRTIDVAAKKTSWYSAVAAARSCALLTGCRLNPLGCVAIGWPAIAPCGDVQSSALHPLRSSSAAACRSSARIGTNRVAPSHRGERAHAHGRSPG